MDKPRLFIGSSVEGLSVAYAIQENLKHVVETTVWDQGVFNLSESSLESLLAVLDNSDFGTFVFTPDDHVKIRGKKDMTIRDNVLFELGLFIGRLGRYRCFIIIPDNIEFHLPTDLIGVTPAKYEAQREDNNLQAGTGSASYKIRDSISKMGSTNSSIVEPETESQISQVTDNVNKTEDWYNLLFVKKKYEEAIKLLKKKSRYSKDIDDKVFYKGQICYAEFQKDAVKGKIEFERLISEYSTNNLSYLAYANCLFYCNLFHRSLEILEEGLSKCERKVILTLHKVDCLLETNQKDFALEFLIEAMKSLKDPDLYIKLSSLHISKEQKKSALEVLYNGFLEYPNNESILYELAKCSYDLGHKDVCILLYKDLIKINDKSQNYWCQLGNAYLDLDFYNLALTAYEKANEFANEKEEWIIANIGNLYNNKKLYNKAEFYLNQALKISEKSEYTHLRLSQIYQSRQDEIKKLDEVLKTAKSKMSGTFLT